MKLKFCPIVLTYENRNDITKVINSLKNSFSAAKVGFEKGSTWIEKDKNTGVALIKVKAENRIIVAVFVNKTDLKNSEFFKKFLKVGKKEIKTVPVTITDVGPRANLKDVTKNIDAWNELQKPYVKGGVEAGEWDLQVTLETYHGEDDPRLIAKDIINPSATRKLIKTKKGLEVKKMLRLSKEIAVQVLITKASVGNMINITIFFDNTDLQNSDRYKKSLKSGKLMIPITDVGLRATWKDLVKTAKEFYK